MTSETIKKYSKYSVAELKKKAQVVFNKWIRERDKDEQCISCPSRNTSTASHFYSAGHHNALRFNEDNVHISCHRCNYFLHGNLSEYRVRLEKRIGKERLDALDELAALSKRNRSFKFSRFDLINIIEKYKL
jgi:heterodisulfide reductase subunit B